MVIVLLPSLVPVRQAGKDLPATGPFVKMPASWENVPDPMSAPVMLAIKASYATKLCAKVVVDRTVRVPRPITANVSLDGVETAVMCQSVTTAVMVMAAVPVPMSVNVMLAIMVCIAICPFVIQGVEAVIALPQIPVLVLQPGVGSIVKRQSVTMPALSMEAVLLQALAPVTVDGKDNSAGSLSVNTIPVSTGSAPMSMYAPVLRAMVELLALCPSAQIVDREVVLHLKSAPVMLVGWVLIVACPFANMVAVTAETASHPTPVNVTRIILALIVPSQSVTVVAHNMVPVWQSIPVFAMLATLEITAARSSLFASWKFNSPG